MLIGVTGNKGSGKDTFAGAFNHYNLKFAGPLKDMLRTLYRAADVPDEIIERKIEGDLKEEPCEILGGATPRWAMQTLGTEWAKMVDPTHTLWSRIFRNKAVGLLRQGLPITCTDVRFEHEAKVLRDLGGRLVRVHRPGNETEDMHASELEMEGLEVDTTVYNAGSIKDLHNKATTYLQEQTK